MLNYVWGAMIILGIAASLFTGRIADVSNAAISAGKEGVSVALTMLGVVATWTGIMKIAQKGGAIEMLSKKLMPVLRYLFPKVPKNHAALQYISANFIANFLGLGWAATPAGIMAMKELQKLNTKKDEATNAMSMFLIINMSSVQLISVNLIAYRQQCGSENPAEILGACLAATIVSTITGITYAKAAERRRKA